jgi:hypothetical protein
MNFEELAAAVATQIIGSAKLTDIKPGIYTLLPGATVDDPCHLVSEKKQKYPISVRSLAAMRIVTDASKVTAKTTVDARESEQFTNLQSALVNDGLKISESTKFNVVGQLKIMDIATDEPVYKNQHYQGYADYVKKTRKIANLPRKTQEERDARTAGFTDASEALRATGVNKGAKAPKADDLTQVLTMPYFTVSN